MAATKTTTRRRRSTNGSAVADLKTTVDSLIRENRTLKRQLAKLEAASVTTGRGRRANPITTGVSALTRKVERALAAGPPGTRRRSSSSMRAKTTNTRTTKTRRPSSPETQAKRLAALAKAREARAAKKAAAGSAS
jgi:hypothetical protein